MDGLPLPTEPGPRRRNCKPQVGTKNGPSGLKEKFSFENEVLWNSLEAGAFPLAHTAGCGFGLCFSGALDNELDFQGVGGGAPRSIQAACERLCTELTSVLCWVVRVASDILERQRKQAQQSEESGHLRNPCDAALREGPI